MNRLLVVILLLAALFPAVTPSQTIAADPRYCRISTETHVTPSAPARLVEWSRPVPLQTEM